MRPPAPLAGWRGTPRNVDLHEQPPYVRRLPPPTATAPGGAGASAATTLSRCARCHSTAATTGRRQESTRHSHVLAQRVRGRRGGRRLACLLVVQPLTR